MDHLRYLMSVVRHLMSVTCHLIPWEACPIPLGYHPMWILSHSISFVPRYFVSLRMSPFDASNDQTVVVSKIRQSVCICQYLEGGEQILKCHVKTRFTQAR